MISVCYLLRVRRGGAKKKDLSDLDKFISSYNAYPSGAIHRLNILVKGPAALQSINEIANLVPETARIIYVKDQGYDLGSYTEFAIYYSYPLIFFLNQHSIIEKKDWLNIYLKAKVQSNANVVGSTASYSSLSNPYIPEKEYFNIKNYLKKIIASIKYREFPKYPNPHIRTNALLVEKNVWCNYFGEKKVKSKKHCYRAESGPNSFLRFLINNSYRFALVRGDGLYENKVENWKSVVGFRNLIQDEQIIISDNHTRFYSEAPVRKKNQLYAESWR